MRIDVDTLLDSTVTVINRVNAKDAGLKQDAYYSTTLTPANWSEQRNKTMDADGTVHLSVTARAQIPASVGSYVPYREFCAALSAVLPGEYTASLGDYVVRGVLSLESPTTREKVLAALKGTEHFEVATVRDLRDSGATDASPTGCTKYLSCIHLEGM